MCRTGLIAIVLGVILLNVYFFGFSRTDSLEGSQGPSSQGTASSGGKDSGTAMPFSVQPRIITYPFERWFTPEIATLYQTPVSTLLAKYPFSIDESYDYDSLPTHPVYLIHPGHNDPNGCYPQLEDALQAVATDNKQVLVIPFNKAFLSMTLNLVQSIGLQGIKNFLLIAFDAEAERLAGKVYHLPCWAASDLDFFNRPDSGKLHSWTEASYHQITQRKGTLVRRILSLGYDVLFVDADLVFLKDPYPFIFGQPNFQSVDLWIQNDGWSPCTGFYWLRANEKSIKFWEAIEAHGKSRPTITDQHSLNDVLKEWGPKKKITYQLLPEDIFPVGNLYFDRETPQQRGADPIIVHNNWAIGDHPKVMRFKERGLWFLRERDDYYDNKFIAFNVAIDPTERAPEAQRAALRNALAIAMLLDRRLILPTIYCRGMMGRIDVLRQEWCISDVLEKDRIYDVFEAIPGYREHNIIFNPLFRPFNDSSAKFHIVAHGENLENFQGKDSDFIVLQAEDSECGLTEEELRTQLKPFESVRVLWFSNLLNRFKGPKDEAVKQQLKSKLIHGLGQGHYRSSCSWWM
jgi:hypothetical protein